MGSQHVQCYDSHHNVLSVIYDPNGNALSHGELVTMINTLLDENVALREMLDLEDDDA